jgi:hypothetical protein
MFAIFPHKSISRSIKKQQLDMNKKAQNEPAAISKHNKGNRKSTALGSHILKYPLIIRTYKISANLFLFYFPHTRVLIYFYALLFFQL